MIRFESKNQATAKAVDCFDSCLRFAVSADVLFNLPSIGFAKQKDDEVSRGAMNVIGRAVPQLWRPA